MALAVALSGLPVAGSAPLVGLFDLAPQGGPAEGAVALEAEDLADPYLDRQWALSAAPGIGALDAWERGRGNGSVVVAVLDTGIEADHEDLALTVLAGYDALNVDDEPEDDCGHGTHVAGTIGALGGNGLGVAGVANVSLLPVKVLGMVDGRCTGSFAGLEAAILWAADNGADVLSISLGCPPPCYHNGVARAVRHAQDAGALVVAAAGNATGGPVYFPANLPGIVAVGALAKDGSWARYSAVGPEVALVAPGSKVLSTYVEDSYTWMSGTSMAAPHVAGAAALLLARGAGSADEARALLLESARDLGLDAEHQGAGALDLAAALEALAAHDAGTD